MAEPIDIALRLRRGEFALEVAARLSGQGITAISGPSGSGKTSLLRAIAGLEPAAEGHVRIGDRVWQSADRRVPPHRRRIGMVFQEPRLFPHLDVSANLRFGARRAGQGRRTLAPIVDALGLTPLLARSVRGLSGGEQRRVALGRALAMAPRLLCLDEPLVGLDREAKETLLPYVLAAVRHAGCPTLYVSHDQMEIMALADEILNLSAGKLVGSGSLPVRDRLELPVVAVGSGQVTLALGGNRVTLPGTGQVGELRGVHVPADAVLVATSPPQVVAAPVVLEARLAELSAGPDGTRTASLRLSDGTMLRAELQGGAEGAMEIAPGHSLFAVPLRMRLLPNAAGGGAHSTAGAACGLDNAALYADSPADSRDRRPR